MADATKIRLLLEGIDRASSQVKQVNAEVAALGTTAATANAQAAPLAKNITAASAAAKTAATSTATFTNSVKAGTAGLRAMQGMLVLVGAQAFPQLTAAALTATSAVQGLTAGARASGLAMTTLGPMAALAAAAIATVTSAIKLNQAEAELAATRKGYLQDQADHANKLLPMLREAAMRGFITAKEAERLTTNLAGSAGNAGAMSRALNEARNAVVAMKQADLKFSAGKEFEAFMALSAESLLSQPEQALAQLNRDLDEFVSKATTLAVAVGADQQRVITLANQMGAKAKADIEVKALQETEQRLIKQRGAELTNLQQVADMKSRLHIESLDGIAAELAAIDAYYDRELERLDDLKLSLKEEADLREKINEARKAKKTKAEKKRTEEIDTTGTIGFGVQDIFEKLDKDEHERTEAQNEERRKRVEAERQMWQDLLTVAKAGGREGFIAYKAMATAIATVSTAKAAINAYSAMAGIPYVGPILGVVAAAAAVAAGAVQIAAINSATYERGGYTGQGGKNEPAGTVHKGEFVIPAWRVAQIGLPELDQITFGSSYAPMAVPKMSYAHGGLVAATPSSQSFQFALIDNRQDRRDWEARKGMKVLLGELQRRGNRIST